MQGRDNVLAIRGLVGLEDDIGLGCSDRAGPSRWWEKTSDPRNSRSTKKQPAGLRSERLFLGQTRFEWAGETRPILSGDFLQTGYDGGMWPPDTGRGALTHGKIIDPGPVSTHSPAGTGLDGGHRHDDLADARCGS